MIFAKAQALEVWCPFAPVGSAVDPIRGGRTGCIADRCAYYRAVDEDRGYCGGGGPPAGLASDSVVAEPHARLPREVRPASSAHKRGR